MTCSSCGHNLHLGKSCSGIAESTFAAMNAEKKIKWTCKICRTKGARSGEEAVDVNSEVRSLDDPGLLGAQIQLMNRKLDSLPSLKVSVDSLLELPAKVSELLLLKPAIELLKTTVEEVQISITALGKKYEDLLSMTTSHAEEMKDLRMEMGTLKATVSEQEQVIQRLKSEINESEQHTRLQNMEVHGLKVAPNESLASALTGLALKLELAGHQPSDVVTAYKIPNKRAETPVILVRFASVDIKERWMQSRSRLRQSFGSRTSERVYFNDNLTQPNRELFWMARSRGKEYGFKFVWVKNARIFARKEEGAPLIKILHRNDIDLIV